MAFKFPVIALHTCFCAVYLYNRVIGKNDIAWSYQLVELKGSKATNLARTRRYTCMQRHSTACILAISLTVWYDFFAPHLISSTLVKCNKLVQEDCNVTELLLTIMI